MWKNHVTEQLSVNWKGSKKDNVYLDETISTFVEVYLYIKIKQNPSIDLSIGTIDRL